MDEAGTGELRTGTRLVSESSRLPVFASVLKWLPRISRFFLAALFLFTAGAKLAIAKAFAQNVAQLLSASGFNYERWSWPEYRQGQFRQQ